MTNKVYLNLNLGSSETIRDTFLFWFIGFSEGDGSFIVNKNLTLEFKITQSSNDAQILFFIKKVLGFGSVRVQDKINKTHHFRVRDQKNLEKIIKLFNGKLHTTYKYNQFSVFVNAYNLKYDSNIPLIKTQPKFSLGNAWLSGFTDAEGCFTLSILDRGNWKQVQLRYILSQKGEKELLDDIGKNLKGRTHYLKSYEGYNLTVNYLNLSRIIKYIETYPLLTKKKVTYIKFKKVYKMMKEEKHKTEKGLKKIVQIKKKWRDSPNF